MELVRIMAPLNAQPFDYNHRPGPRRLNLLLSGFYKQNIISTETLVEALDALPEDHIRGLQVIKYDPQRIIQRTIAQSGITRFEPHLMGAYYHASDLAGIVLYEFDSEAMFYHMLYHEIGHYVFLRVIDQTLRDQWFYRVRAAEKRFVSQYASTNAAEDFAECYAYFCVYPQVLWKIQPKMRYIAEQIFYLDPGSYDFSEPSPTPASSASLAVPPAYPEIN